MVLLDDDSSSSTIISFHYKMTNYFASRSYTKYSAIIPLPLFLIITVHIGIFVLWVGVGG